MPIRRTVRSGVDIRNVITHNRGIVNRFFIHRNPAFTADLGKRIVLNDEQQREMLGTLGFCARQLDIRAVKKFGLIGIMSSSDTAVAPK